MFHHHILDFGKTPIELKLQMQYMKLFLEWLDNVNISKNLNLNKSNGKIITRTRSQTSKVHHCLKKVICFQKAAANFIINVFALTIELYYEQK